MDWIVVGCEDGGAGSSPRKFVAAMQVPFDFAQGRLSAPLKNASLRMTAFY
jgi:hypothetical protein